jgi:hypothetical protein
MTTTSLDRPLNGDLDRLCELVDRDGIDAHAAVVGEVADAVRAHSPLLAAVLTGPYVAPMRERALVRAVRVLAYAELRRLAP